MLVRIGAFFVLYGGGIARLTPQWLFLKKVGWLVSRDESSGTEKIGPPMKPANVHLPWSLA